MNFSFKNASTQEDYEKIAALAQRVWHYTYDPLIGTEQTAYMIKKFQSADALESAIRDSGYIYRMAVTEERLAAYCGVCPEPEGAVFLSKVYVDPQFQRQGLAKALILHFAKDYAAQGFSRMYLTVNKGNENAIKAYKKLGFHFSGTLVTDIGGGFVMDDNTMELDLSHLSLD